MIPPVQPPTDPTAVSDWIDRTFCPICEERRGFGSCRHVEPLPPQPPTDRTES